MLVSPTQCGRATRTIRQPGANHRCSDAHMTSPAQHEPSSPAILGVILAGGLARRMGGGDKAKQLVGGRPVLDHLLERLTGQVDRVVVNANGDPARFAPLPVIPDTLPGNPGPLAGVLAGMEHGAAAGLL